MLRYVEIGSTVPAVRSQRLVVEYTVRSPLRSRPDRTATYYLNIVAYANTGNEVARAT